MKKYTEYKNTLELVKEKSSENKEFAFFIQDKDVLSYKELYELSTQYGILLKNLGLVKKDGVVIICPKNKDLILSYLGIVISGGIAYVADVNAPAEEIIKNTLRLEAKTIICHQSLKQKGEDVQKGVQGSKLLILDEIELPEFEELENDIDPDDPAMCVFTSGSTGDPKGILSSHRNILFAASALEKSHDIGSSDKVLSVTPFSGTNCQVFTFWVPMYTGGSAVYYQGMFNSYTTFQAIQEHKITWFNCIPTHVTILLNKPIDPKEFDYSSLKFVRTASAPLMTETQEKFESFYGVKIIETMGLSEMTGQVFANSLKDRRIGSVGKAIDTEIKFVDGDEERGEIYVKSPGLMKEYLNDPETTKKAIKDGWLMTGDIVRKDKDGFFYVLDRKKNIIIVGGKNVSSREVEETIYKNSSIAEAVVIGAPNKITGEEVVAVVKLIEGGKISLAKIRKQCKESLPDYKCPVKLITVQEFPRGGQGKILKAKVKENYLNGEYDE